MREGSRRGQQRLTPGGTDLLIVATVAVAAVVTGLAAANRDLERSGLAIALALAGLLAPVVAGMFAIRHDRAPGFGRLLIVLGLAWGATGLANAGSSLLFSAGRVAGWLTIVLILYVLLAYPYGRLVARRDKLIVAAAAALVALLYLPTALLDPSYPVPAPWGTCVDECPTNAFALADGDSAVLQAMTAIRWPAAMALFVAASLSIVARMWRASGLQRRGMLPVAVVAVATLLIDATFLVLRAVDAPEGLVVSSAAVAASVVPLVSVGFLVSMLRWRLRTAAALEHVTLRTASLAGPEQLERELRAALADPDLRLYLREDGISDWTDTSGARVAPPASKVGTVEVRDQGGSLCAMIVCDPEIARPGLTESLGGLVLGACERWRLRRALSASLTDLAASRRRLATAADAERRRIERDLHDGAQQRLIALRLRLAALEDTMDDERTAALVRELGDGIEAAIDEVRSLARGIYPSLLTDAGPIAALHALAFTSPLPIRVAAAGVGRHPEHLESAVYFCCLEAIQNAIKHAPGASRIDVALIESDGYLRFEVQDDGSGFQGPPNGGHGFVNMADRVAAFGGTLTVDGGGSTGARITGVVPLAPVPFGSSTAASAASQRPEG